MGDKNNPMIHRKGVIESILDALLRMPGGLIRS